MNRAKSLKSGKTKRLAYVLNYISADDTQHFSHILPLLQTMRDVHGWNIRLLSEKGGQGSTHLFGMDVHYLSKHSRVRRIVALIGTLIRLRLCGYRLIFVRISRPAAIVCGAIGRLIGMGTLYWQSGTVHDFGARTLRERLSDLLLVSLIERFVTGPEAMLDYYAETLSVPERKLLLLYNDIDLRRFDPSITIHGDGALRLLFVHRFSPVRETGRYLPAIIDRLNRATAEGLTFHLTFVGGGPELPQLKTLSQSASPGLTIDFLGPVPNAQVQEHYARADVFIMPSYREGFPRVMIEAMAMALPIVATDAGGTRDLVGPLQDGFIVSRDDPNALAERLVDLARSPLLRANVGAENRAHVARYSTPAVAAMYDRALADLL